MHDLSVAVVLNLGGHRVILRNLVADSGKEADPVLFRDIGLEQLVQAL